MTDPQLPQETPDPMVAELRRTLRQRAAAVRPSPGEVPTVMEKVTAWRRLGPRPTMIGAGIAAAALVAAAIGWAVSGGGHSKTTVTNIGGAPTSAVPTTPAPVVTQVPATTTPSAAVTTNPPTTAPPSQPVPAGFVPLSVTFVSANQGWVLGAAPCQPDLCAALAATGDGGRTWSAVNAPPDSISPAGLIGPVGIRFADPLDGWVWTPAGMWSTHDGAKTWHAVSNPAGSSAQVEDLEASGGRAYLVAVDSNGRQAIFSTAAGRDQWTESGLHPNIGAGPVPSSQIVLWGSQGWIVDNNRTAVSGARLQSGSDWAGWNPPCAKADGPATMAAASSTDIVTVCGEGEWGTPDAGTTAGQDWLFRSSDGGSTFQAVGPVTSMRAGMTSGLTVTPGNVNTIVALDSSGLQATFDGGATWGTVYTAPPGSGAAFPYTGFEFVGFTTATQGVAVVRGSSTPILVMTRDGGHTWTQINF